MHVYLTRCYYPSPIDRIIPIYSRIDSIFRIEGDETITLRPTSISIPPTYIHIKILLTYRLQNVRGFRFLIVESVKLQHFLASDYENRTHCSHVWRTPLLHLHSNAVDDVAILGKVLTEAFWKEIDRAISLPSLTPTCITVLRQPSTEDLLRIITTTATSNENEALYQFH